MSVYRDFGGTLSTVIADGWRSGMQANRFSPVGREWAFLYHFSMHALGTKLGIDMHWLYRAGAFALLWLAALSAAFFLSRAARFVHAANRLPVWPVFAAICGIVAVTMQLHPWSHDPMITISEIGVGVVALCFMHLGLSIWAVTDGAGRVGPIVVTALSSLVGVTFYESFATAVAGSAIIFAGLGWTRRHDAADRRRLILLLLTAVALPAVVFIVGRLYVNSLGASEYSGTELALSAEGLVPLGVLLAAAIPGTAWAYAADYAQFGIRLSGEALVGGFLIALVLVVMVLWWLRRERERLRVGRRIWLVLAALGVTLGGTLAMHSFTEKYIAEIREIGWIYLSYTLTVLTVAVLVVLLGACLQQVQVRRGLVVLLPLVTVFAMAQQTVNWSVAEEAGQRLAVNRALTNAATEFIPSASERCRLLDAWDTAYTWPEYARQQVIEGINWSYEHDFGEVFCAREP
jgi:hypothetical protein